MGRLFPDGTKLKETRSNWHSGPAVGTYFYMTQTEYPHWVVFTDGRAYGAVRPGVFGYGGYYMDKEEFLECAGYQVLVCTENTLGNFPKRTEEAEL